MLEQVETARLASLPAPARAQSLNRSAHENLDRGLLLEAEREFQAAIAADPTSSDAHLGLAQLRERAGDMESARREARSALSFHPSAEAWLVLARIDLSSSQLPQAREDAGEALKLDAVNRAARDLRKTIDARIDAAQSAPTQTQTPPADSTTPNPDPKP